MLLLKGIGGGMPSILKYFMMHRIEADVWSNLHWDNLRVEADAWSNIHWDGERIDADVWSNLYWNGFRIESGVIFS